MIPKNRKNALAPFTRWKFLQFLIAINVSIRKLYAAHRLPRLSLQSFRQREFMRKLRLPDEAHKNQLYRKNVGTLLPEFEILVLSRRGDFDCLFCLQILRLPFRRITPPVEFS